MNGTPTLPAPDGAERVYVANGSRITRVAAFARLVSRYAIATPCR